MKKYKIISIPSKQGVHWWNPDRIIEVIDLMEKSHPKYIFHQIITSPGNGGHPHFAIMKKKKK